MLTAIHNCLRHGLLSLCFCINDGMSSWKMQWLKQLLNMSYFRFLESRFPHNRCENWILPSVVLGCLHSEMQRLTEMSSLSCISKILIKKHYGATCLIYFQSGLWHCPTSSAWKGVILQQDSNPLMLFWNSPFYSTGGTLCISTSLLILLRSRSWLRSSKPGWYLQCVWTSIMLMSSRYGKEEVRKGEEFLLSVATGNLCCA